MKNTKKAIYFISILVFIQLLYTSSIPMARAEDTVPTSYNQNLSFNSSYVYEVIQFGDSAGWYNFTFGFEGNWRTNPKGQIKINLTGFYDKDSNDWGNVFSDPIPWYDIEIYEYNLDLLNMNFTLSNHSNSEVARSLILGYNSFQPGFLIPNENLTNVKQLAVNQSDPGGSFDIVGELNIEESYNFLYVGFSQIGGGQNTELVYDKKTGLLVWAKTSIFGYLLEIKSLNFTVDYSPTFKYNVIEFGGGVEWYNLTFGLEGEWGTNAGGQININFTGFYNKDPNDWGNLIDDPIPWFDIEIVKNISGILMTNFTLVNRSNSEISWGLTFGYNYFQPGFLIQIMDNLTKVKKLALQEATGFVNGIVSLEETKIALKITFDQIGGEQHTKMIYEKLTGLLLWANTSIGSYFLQMALDNYVPWESTGAGISPPENLFMRLLPYIVIASISITLISASLITSRFKTKFKKFNKYILIAILASASFASFFVFASSIEVGEVNEPLRTVQDITLIVDYGNGTVKTRENFELTNYNTTAFDALIKWCEIEYTDYGDMGLIVESIDGIGGIGANWRYSINDEFPGVSAYKYNLKNGDIVKWIFGF